MTEMPQMCKTMVQCDHCDRIIVLGVEKRFSYLMKTIKLDEILYGDIVVCLERALQGAFASACEFT